MTLSVFLSHSVGEAENRMVDELSARLTGAQVPHYVAKYDRQPGVYLSEKVRGHIEASPVLFALITRRGQDSRYVNQEIGYALRGKSRVIAFVEDGAWEGAMIAGVEQVPFSSDAPSKDIAAVTEFVARLKAEADLR
ncbi:MAG TPA: toll/interleukin-1 receptor domain-containing protein, partial [Nitrososphaerales archaeon]|nr:toll/interleukin-1 receptor domain-containing protein [Nitrososphaerales archaeon]